MDGQTLELCKAYKAYTINFNLVGSLTNQNPYNCLLGGGKLVGLCWMLAAIWLPAKILRNAFKKRGRGGIKVCDDFQKLSRILRSPNSFDILIS